MTLLNGTAITLRAACGILATAAILSAADRARPDDTSALAAAARTAAETLPLPESWPRLLMNARAPAAGAPGTTIVGTTILEIPSPPCRSRHRLFDAPVWPGADRAG